MNIITRNTPRQYLRNGDLNLAEGGVAYYSSGISSITGAYLPALPMEDGGYLVETPVTFMQNILMKRDLTVEGNTNIAGNTHIEGDLQVDGSTTLGGDTDINGNLNITGEFTVNGKEFEAAGYLKDLKDVVYNWEDVPKEYWDVPHGVLTYWGYSQKWRYRSREDHFYDIMVDWRDYLYNKGGYDQFFNMYYQYQRHYDKTLNLYKVHIDSLDVEELKFKGENLEDYLNSKEYEYLSFNTPLDSTASHLFVDRNKDLIFSYGNPPIYNEPIPTDFSDYTYAKLNITRIVNLAGICMNVSRGYFPSEVDIWLYKDQKWGRVYRRKPENETAWSKGWYMDINAAQWISSVDFCYTSEYSQWGYSWDYDHLGLDVKELGEYEVYVKYTDCNIELNLDWRYIGGSTAGNVINGTYYGVTPTKTNETYISDDYHNHPTSYTSTWYKVYTSNTIDKIGIDKTSTSVETKLLGSLTLANDINLSVNKGELVVSTGKIQGFYTKEEVYSKEQTEEHINARNDQFQQTLDESAAQYQQTLDESVDKFTHQINSWMIPYDDRLDSIEGLLGDIELLLDKILGYETNKYLNETLDEIIG